jgi:hypothetical protein
MACLYELAPVIAYIERHGAFFAWGKAPPTKAELDADWQRTLADIRATAKRQGSRIQRFLSQRPQHLYAADLAYLANDFLAEECALLPLDALFGR